MAIHRNRIDYTVFAPDFQEGHSWDVRSFAKARKLAKSLGIGARIWQNINRRDKDKPVADFWQKRVFEWTGTALRDISHISGRP
jgi:hypothetical protein